MVLTIFSPGLRAGVNGRFCLKCLNMHVGEAWKTLQMMPCFLKSACSSPDTQPKTFGSSSSFWTK